MKVCRIVDEARGSLLIGYLLAFEHGASFSIELSEKLRIQDAPIYFEGYIRRGELTVDPVWSERWVHSRIVPEDRQNLGSVLRDNKLSEYDPFRLLMLGGGRCAQDDCAVIPSDAADIPDWLHSRRQRALECAVIIGSSILSIFRDGTIWRADPIEEGLAEGTLARICGREDLMRQMKMIPGGLGVQWQEDVMLTAGQLYGRGVRLPIDHGELDRLLMYYLMLTPDVCSEMNCSRQYIDKKVREGSLRPIKDSGNTRLYTAAEISRFKE